jgi:uncharacterized protein (TIRG00374 family)
LRCGPIAFKQPQAASGRSGSMLKDDAPTPEKRGSPLRRLINILLALAGLGLFCYLVAQTGVTLKMLREFGWWGLSVLLVASSAVVILDTIAWRYAIRHVASPRFFPLFGLRIAGDAVTNGLPGGVVFGETYKAVMLKRWYGVSIADNAASLLMVKFGLGFSQALFVVIGLGLIYVPLSSRSVDLFGFNGAQYVSLAMTLGMGLLMFFPLWLMFRGNSFAGAAKGLSRLPSSRLRAFLRRKQAGIESLDKACTDVLRDNRAALMATFAYLFSGWVASSLESYVILYFLGLSPTYQSAYVTESVGSMFRLVFFMVPSGIGGQDASFLALFRLHGYPRPAAGAFVLLKRFKEVVWIGLGFLLIVLFGRKEPIGDAQRVE